MTISRETAAKLTEALFFVDHRRQRLVGVEHFEPVVVTESDALIECHIEFGYFFDELCVERDPGDLPEEGGYIASFDPDSGHVVRLRGFVTRGKTSFGGRLTAAEFREAYAAEDLDYPDGFDAASVPYEGLTNSRIR